MDTLKHIFVVEDDPDIRSIIQMSLETIGGYTVDTACNGAEALQRLDELRPDLILLDVMMPRMDGPGNAPGSSPEPCVRIHTRHFSHG